MFSTGFDFLFVFRVYCKTTNSSVSCQSRPPETYNYRPTSVKYNYYCITSPVNSRAYLDYPLLSLPLTRQAIQVNIVRRGLALRTLFFLNEPCNAHCRRDDEQWDRAGRQVALASATGNAVFRPSDDRRARWQGQEERRRDGPRDMGEHSTPLSPAPGTD
jgi:hypothetical protein